MSYREFPSHQFAKLFMFQVRLLPGGHHIRELILIPGEVKHQSIYIDILYWLLLYHVSSSSRVCFFGFELFFSFCADISSMMEW